MYHIIFSVEAIVPDGPANLHRKAREAPMPLHRKVPQSYFRQDIFMHYTAVLLIHETSYRYLLIHVNFARNNN